MRRASPGAGCTSTWAGTSSRWTFVKRYIDLMARYKLNTFHWHLTEDQGWRIEIKKYPRLTEVGACRAETMVAEELQRRTSATATPHCGFYTQDEIREVVRLRGRAGTSRSCPRSRCRATRVAALAAYPELGCGPGPFEVMDHAGASPRTSSARAKRPSASCRTCWTEVLDALPVDSSSTSAATRRRRARGSESALAQEIMYRRER